MSERAHTYEVLDVSLRIGEVLLSSGAGAADVAGTMLAITGSCGVRDVSADVTYVDLTLRYQPSSDAPAAIQTRRVTQREVDYDDLTQVDQLVADLLAGRVSVDETRHRLAQIVSTGHQRRGWTVTAGWGLMGVGLAMTLGGRPIVCALAFLAACTIDWTRHVMSGRVPNFYQQVAGGFVATVIAVVASGTALDVNPSRVVTVGIVMLLAGIGLMGATQDAIMGFPVTATARMLNAILATIGIIGGVSAGLALRGLVGVDLEDFNPGAAGLAENGVQVIGASLAAASFAFASYAPVRALLAVAVVSALAETVLLVVDTAELGYTWGSAAAAVTIGALCHAFASRIRVPPLVIVVPAVVPLLPGLMIYRGLALLADGRDGVPQLVAAAATAIALASGVILGQYLAQPIRKEARWLERRLAGPRLVGPVMSRIRRSR